MPDSDIASAAIDPRPVTQMWLSCPRSAYLVGICGSGMKALAEVLLDQHWMVAGSDTQGNGPVGELLRSKGAQVFATHSAEHIPAGVDLLIYSSAVPEENFERAWAGSHEIPQFAYHDMLGELMSHKFGISISGTHGKSTTTALVGCILSSAGLAPTVIIGAEDCGRRANGWSGDGPHLVAESCEYRRHFLSLQPRFATILGIEADHFDCFSDVEQTTAAFRDFVGQIPTDGLLVIPRECPMSQLAAQAAVCKIETISLVPDGISSHLEVGIDPQNDLIVPSTRCQRHTSTSWTTVDITKTGQGHRFQILRDGHPFCWASLNIPGRHHVLNTLAATALCFRAGATPTQISEGISLFRGIRRRFEVLGEWRGVTVVDDYAHHPTAIRATIQTAKEQYPDRRIVCVFQPHQVSRTLGLLDQFATSFADADQVIVVPVYAARENVQNESAEVSQLVADLIAATGVPGRFSASLDQTSTSLEDTLRPTDVLITLGAGDIDRIHSTLHGLR
jgi:UDP-N-acetylmuramate--alanine ligase